MKVGGGGYVGVMGCFRVDFVRNSRKVQYRMTTGTSCLGPLSVDKGIKNL